MERAGAGCGPGRSSGGYASSLSRIGTVDKSDRDRDRSVICSKTVRRLGLLSRLSMEPLWGLTAIHRPY